MNTERLKEIEEYSGSLTPRKNMETILELVAEILRLRGVLGFYANPDTYDYEYKNTCECCGPVPVSEPPIEEDQGQRARDAIGGV